MNGLDNKLGFFKKFQTNSKSAKGRHTRLHLSLCIQIVSQNIVNSRIVAHNKIKLKFLNYDDYFDNA